MTNNHRRQRVRGTRSVSGGRAAVVAAALVQLAGTATALGQVSPSPAPSQPAAPAPRPASPDSQVRVDDNLMVDLHVNDEDLGNVLEMLSIQSQRNILASKNVSARVTANLYGVTFYQALEAILNVNGYGFIEDNNFIYIYTLEEIKQLTEESRVRVSKVLPLNYLNSNDAAEFVKPLLSEGGQIKTNGKVGNFPAFAEVPIGAEEYASSSMLVVYDYAEHVDEIEALLAQIDTRPAQVLVEATILQTTLNEANAFGVDFSVIADIDFADFVGVGGPLQAANALIGGRNTTGGTGTFPGDGEGRAVSTSVGNTQGAGGLKVGVVSNDVAIFLRVLDEVTDTTILSNPKILALNRQPSRVLVGRKVGYLSTTSTDTATTQTVEFLDTGTQLYFRPFVTNEGMIRMELKPQVSEAVIRETNDATGVAVTIPDEITNELVTNVMVRDGQTIVLGGLFRESTESTRRQVPFLGDIPVIGAAFRGNEDETQRNEIIFLITPTIVNDQTLALQGERGTNYIERIRAGSREGVLPWSRDKLTSMMNVEAERLAQSGQTEKALWKVQRSLSLNSNQPEVIGLRERLTGDKANWPTRSFLDRVLHGESDRVYRDGVSAAPAAAPAGPAAVEGVPSAAATFTPAANLPEVQPFRPAATFAENEPSVIGELRPVAAEATAAAVAEPTTIHLPQMAAESEPFRFAPLGEEFATDETASSDPVYPNPADAFNTGNTIAGVRPTDINANATFPQNTRSVPAVGQIQTQPDPAVTNPYSFTHADGAAPDAGSAWLGRKSFASNFWGFLRGGSASEAGKTITNASDAAPAAIDPSGK